MQENITGKQEEYFEKVLGFLDEIGIIVRRDRTPGTSFLPGLQIQSGTIVADTSQLAYPGDILHEAGHIAVVTAGERARLQDNIAQGRPGTEGEEVAVHLWCYAACLHLGIPPEFVFHPEGYKGDSSWLLKNFAEKIYIGLPLLVWMGLAANPDEPGGYPQMLKWMRD